ncbi:MAG: hypothetical protein E7271_06455 [Lachnospiraceae bacterium]|jgi:predicted metal-dependent peptidase|nr:hypothetical protein [Lachnospiraceae bacterium]
MPTLHKYYYNQKDIPQREQMILNGFEIIKAHPLFGSIAGNIYFRAKQILNNGGACAVDEKGNIYINVTTSHTPEEWAYCMAHSLLHLAFGHFDKDNMPSTTIGEKGLKLWNKACDIYISRFLADIRFGNSIVADPSSEYKIKLNNEHKIYEHLVFLDDTDSPGKYGTATEETIDMIGLEHPITYKNGEANRFATAFYNSINNSVSNAVSTAGGHNWKSEKETPIKKAAEWFLAHYPLLGGIAAGFKIIEDIDFCRTHEIHIAAIDSVAGEIYCNPTANLSTEEWRFVLGHEYLHAGLMHHKRCLGRDRYLWNIACDYCVNGWLSDMEIGVMPADVLFDKDLKSLSAETIYDRIIKEIKKYIKLNTLRGYGKGDIMVNPVPSFSGLTSAGKGISLDEFFKNALREGLDFHTTNNRGYLPIGLVEEIRALTSPPIPWDVELGKWFDYRFPPIEKHHSYARPSRRQSSSPDIPRPRYIMQDKDVEDRTFAVVVDTSGSVSTTQLGLSLGAIVSYANSKDVRYIRIVFCDADAYDQGYMTPDELAGRVKVAGRGGTILQPAIDLIENAKDFPTNGPILIITDGMIENRLHVHRDHAFLLPKGNRLPFKPKGDVFYFK